VGGVVDATDWDGELLERHVKAKEEEGSIPFELFLPNPSLSTTSSAHCIRRDVLGAGAMARKRRTGVDVKVWVIVVVVVIGVERVCAVEEGWWDGAGIADEALGGGLRAVSSGCRYAV